MKIEIRSLSKRYGSLKALQDVNLTIGEGMFGLLGPNGAGKTTLMKIMATVMHPSEGTIRFDGYDVTKHPEEIRKRIGYLPQSFSFYPGVRVGDFLHYVAVLKGMVKEEIQGAITDVLEMVNLADCYNHKIKALSGGMKQRLGIAQAFLGDPEVLIVDEPTAGLDPEERVRFRKILTEMSVGKTIILSTHIAGDIEASCNQVSVLDKGTIRYHGDLESLVTYAQGMVWEFEVTASAYQEIKDSFNVLDLKRQGDSLQVKVLHAQQPSGSQLVAPSVELGYFCLLQNTDNSVDG